MRYKALLLAAAAALAAIPALTPAASEPASAGLALQGNPAGVTNVQYYVYPGGGYYYGYRPYYRDYGLLDIPGDVILGTTGLVGTAPAGPWTPGAVAACARAFRSFNPATGTYTTYSGEQVLCPYLRG
ncbi:MAG: BA14K family protein [Rhodomicrobium sp.]